MNIMRLYVFYVPVNGNDGQAFSPCSVETVSAALAALAGGCTILPECDGFWVSPDGVPYRDVVRPIHAVVPDVPRTASMMKALATRFAVEFDQRELFVTSVPIRVLRVPGDDRTNEHHHSLASTGTASQLPFVGQAIAQDKAPVTVCQERLTPVPTLPLRVVPKGVR